MKYLTALLVMMLTVSLFSGCNRQDELQKKEQLQEDRSESVYISVISKGWQHQFWQAVKMGAYKAAKEYNVNITFEGPEGDAAVSKQIDMINTAFDKHPAALVLAASDSDAVIPELQKYKDANIPIIAFDSGLDGDIPLTTVSTDNYSAAAMAADKMAEAIGEEGEIGIICQDYVSVTGISRQDGFSTRIAEKYPKIKIVDIKYGYGDHDKSKNLVTQMITVHPNMKGIFATNEGSAIGLINCIVENKLEGKLVLVGYDAGKIQKEAIRKNIMLGAISQDPVMIGYKAVEAAYKAYKGEELPKHIDTGFEWYDKSNIDEEALQPSLYD